MIGVVHTGFWFFIDELFFLLYDWSAVVRQHPSSFVNLPIHYSLCQIWYSYLPFAAMPQYALVQPDNILPG